MSITASDLSVQHHANGGGTAIATARTDGDRAIAEVQASMAIAKRFPRDVVSARDRIVNACSRPRLAEGALYSYSRGGTDISGPSIRLAEAIAQQWGNLAFGVRELEQRNGESTVEAFCWDMETNSRSVKVFQVPHVRDTKQGPRALKDSRDIYEHVANMGARRLRSCILAIIPGDIVEEAVSKCEETLTTKCDTGPEAVKKMLSVFREIGVGREQIEARIQCRAEAIRPAQMVQMRKIFASIKDGMSVAADWFSAEENQKPQAPSGPVNTDSLANGTGHAAANPHDKPKSPPAGEQSQEDEAREEFRRKVRADFAACKNITDCLATKQQYSDSGELSQDDLVILGQESQSRIDALKPQQQEPQTKGKKGPPSGNLIQ